VYCPALKSNHPRTWNFWHHSPSNNESHAFDVSAIKCWCRVGNLFRCYFADSPGIRRLLETYLVNKRLVFCNFIL
jgi:hypothetical protein